MFVSFLLGPAADCGVLLYLVTPWAADCGVLLYLVTPCLNWELVPVEMSNLLDGPMKWFHGDSRKVSASRTKRKPCARGFNNRNQRTMDQTHDAKHIFAWCCFVSKIVAYGRTRTVHCSRYFVVTLYLKPV